MFTDYQSLAHGLAYAPLMPAFTMLLWPIAAVMAAANAMGLVIAYGGRQHG